MVREINVNELTENIREMCIQANYYLASDMDACMRQAAETEKSELGTKILNQLLENLEIADAEQIPICQDTGMAVIFMEIGQDVHFIGGNFEEAVHLPDHLSVFSFLAYHITPNLAINLE